MLHKCANPACTVPFRSLREGKLFLAETFPTDLNAAFDGNRRKLRRREHFWLCDACSAHFTLRFDTTLGMLTVPLSERRVHDSSPAPLAVLADFQRDADGLRITKRSPCSVCSLDTFATRDGSWWSRTAGWTA